jgi:signal transduction histidine kinase/DNA-binding response OmpR family regulator
MEEMGIYTFRYFPQEKMIINADNTMKLYGCQQIYTDMPDSFIDNFVEEVYQKDFRKMYQEMDQGKAHSALVFRTKKDHVCRVTLILTAVDEDGKPLDVIGIVEDVSDVIQKELESEKEYMHIISGLGSIYFAIYQIDFISQTFQELVTKENIRMQLGSKGDARQALVDMVQYLVLPPTQDAMNQFNDVSTMPERLKHHKIIAQDYVGLTTGWSRASIIATEWDATGCVTKALYCTRSVSDEKEKLDAQSNLINALASTYQDVYVINMDTGEMAAYRMGVETTLLYGKYFSNGSYDKNIKMYLEDAVCEEDRALFDKVHTIHAVRQSFCDAQSFSFRYRVLSNGQEKYIQAQYIQPSKERNEFITAFKDVDDEVRKEVQKTQAINEQLGMIRALSDKYDAVFLVDAKSGAVIPYRVEENGKFGMKTQINRGLTWDELLGEFAQNSVHPDYKDTFLENVCVKHIAEELEKKHTYIYEYRSSHENGEHYYQLKAVWMPGEDLSRIIIGTSDVNEERQHQIEIQKALQDAYDSATAANHAKSDFLANMSHDIRTPMNGIIGMTAIAGTHIDDKERVQDCLQKITAASKHLLSLINEVLDMSKIESGKVDMAEEDFNLSELVDNLLVMVRPQIEAHRHDLAVNINSVEHEKVIGDSLRMQQLFVNLLSNAIKYTPDGGKIKISITEKPTNEHRLGWYEVIFEDNGIGMTEEFAANIFEPFARAKDARIGKVQGTGLGMAISRNIVHMMGGDIKVESKLNVGTKFIVTFYLKLQETQEVRYEDFVDLPVLVTDDDEASMESARVMLLDLGMDAEGVCSGEEALKRIIDRHERSDDYFAVIVDWKMPGMDGLATTRAIREAVGNDVPIIIISAYDWSDIEHEARKAGATDFISKPLFKSRLAHLFNRLVGNEEEEAQIAPLQDFSEMDLSGYHVLLVEDNELNAEIAKEILEMTGICVDCAEDGSDAVELVRDPKNTKYDLILMDVQMPKMNGYDATRAIRNLDSEYCKSVPIVAMTANAFAEDVQAALSAGMNEHIAKPLNMDELAKVLNKWVLCVE